jgi:uncharacterized membrane protein
MSESYQVVFTGELQAGMDAEQVIDRFSEKFKLERPKAEKVVSGGRPVVLKKGLDQQTAEKYQKVLQAIGMMVALAPKPESAEVVTEAPQPPETSEAPEAAETPAVAEAPAPYEVVDASAETPAPEAVESEEPPPAVKVPTGLALEPLDNGGDDTTEVLDPMQGPDRCPKCGSNRMEMGICQSCGIVASKFLAAQARQTGAAEEEESYEEEDSANPYNAPEADLVDPLDGELSGPRAVAAGNAIGWLGEGWGYFKASPMAWILAMVIWFVISIVVSMIPFIGSLVITLVGPVIMAGFLLGCREQDEGGSFAVSHLFAGFSQNGGQLVLVGLLYLVMMIVVGAVVGLGMFFSMGGLGGMAFEDPQAMEMAGSGFGIGFYLFGLLGFFLMIAVVMSYIFAPALVAIGDLNALDAMKLSFKGCLVNLLPLLLYVLAAIVLMVIGAIPLFLGLLVVLPMLTASNYAAYKDIYYA